MNLEKTKSKIFFDFVLNICAATLPIIVLQLIVYPITAKNVGAEEYGLMLTIYSVWIMVSNSLGNVLNNIRLLFDNKYNEKNINGDFNYLFVIFCIINVIVIFGMIIYYYHEFELVHIILGSLVSILLITKAYWEVGFRLKLNYKAILLNNILQCFGFITGAVCTYFTNTWEFIFLFGYLFSVIYCGKKNKLYRETFKRTFLFREVTINSIKLVIATVISSMMNYADKLILYPLMGGYAVSIYYTASILGKMVGMLTGPINSVILSYISRWKKNNKSLISRLMIITLLLCIIGYAVTLCISRPVIGILFPQWVDEVMKLIPITTISVLLVVMSSIFSPFVLKFCDMKWQIVINGASALIYFIFAYVLWNSFGLIGFCFGVMIGNIIKLILMTFVYFFMSNNKEKEKCNSEI